MTGQELMRSIDKRVRVNEAGQRAFNNVTGEFYLVGFSVEMLASNGKRRPVYCGKISRTLANRQSQSVNAAYIELI